jgi:hypothetical protein
MRRANRHFLASYVWHLTQLCSGQFQSFQWFDEAHHERNLNASLRSKLSNHPNWVQLTDPADGHPNKDS